MSKVLLTGANGFIAAHICRMLVEAGFNVTGSVRSNNKKSQILTDNPEYNDKVNLIVVPDFVTPGVWDEAFQQGDFHYVVHTAAPVPDDPQNHDFDKDFLDPALKGNFELLESAHKYGKNLKHITITGSVASVINKRKKVAEQKDAPEEQILTAADWNPVTPDIARKLQDPRVSYCSAKTESERAVWNFVKEKKPSFDVSVLLPSLVFGPPIQSVMSLKRINLTTDLVYSLFNGSLAEMQPAMSGSYVDVRDLAIAHIKVLSTPAAANQRFIIGTKTCSPAAVVKVICEHFPALQDRCAKDTGADTTPPFFFDDGSTVKALDISFRPFEETFVDTTTRILELEKKLGG